MKHKIKFFPTILELFLILFGACYSSRDDLPRPNSWSSLCTVVRQICVREAWVLHVIAKREARPLIVLRGDSVFVCIIGM